MTYPPDGTQIRYTLKNGTTGVGVVTLVFMAEDVPCVKVLTNEGRIVHVFQELGDTLEEIS